MFDQWDELQKRHDQLMGEITSPSLDNNKRHEIQKELSRLTFLLQRHGKIQSLHEKIRQTEAQIASETDAELLDLFKQELVELTAERTQEEQELDHILYPPDEHDNRCVYLEIRAGAGGKEASLFAADLLKMYTHYAEKKGWKVSVEDSSQTDLGGLREVVLYIKGKEVYGHLKHESGVHRVQRVPTTETQGRIHTSTATVAVLPEADEVDVTINPADLRVDTYRAGGAGGQHVNKTDSAVRITHIPTGVVVACQEERSQHKNRAKAMKLLQSRILAAQVEKQQSEISQQRKELVGSGMRAEKVRTYNYPQNRVTDHQVEMTLNKLDIIMTGELDEIIQALRAKDVQDRKARLSIVKKS